MKSPTEPTKAFVAAISKVLRPLVRVMIMRGITLPFLNQLLKKLFVEVADRDFRLADKSQTDSRLSLLTGVHRKDVRRIRAEAQDIEALPAGISLGAQVVANWVSERRYLDAKGKPKVLPLRNENARTASFETLVASVSRQDLRPRVVLDELVRLGIVTLEEPDHVQLRHEAFIPAHGSDEQLHYFGQNLRDHALAAVHNLEQKKPTNLERAVSYHGLTEEAVHELRELSASLASDALKEVNRRAKQLKKRSEKQGNNDQRISFGSYFYSGAEEDEQ